MGHADSAEVRAYRNVTKKYASQVAPPAEVEAADAPPEPGAEVEVEDPASEGKGQDFLSKTRRICPNCGSHDINEVLDKTRIVSYIPKPMFAKKYVCRKCAWEFS